MQEKRIIELLTRKLAGEASVEELNELKELVRQNPDVLNTEELCRKIWNASSEETNDEAYYKRHLARHQNTLQFDDETYSVAIPENVVPKKRNAIAVVSTLAFVTLVTSFCFYYFTPNKETKISTIIEIVAPRGVRRLVTLPDSSKVWLNADSKLSYDAGMKSKNTRLVYLTGEAYFDISPDKNHPFLIRTSRISLKVLGTAFNVMAYPGEKKCVTTLFRGSIELSLNEGAKQRIILKPFDQVSVAERVNSDTNIISISSILPSKPVQKKYVAENSWMDNKLVFENETFEDIVPKLERWFNVEITIKSKKHARYKFTGAFTNETIHQALTVMQLIKPFNFTRHEKNITIY